MSRIYVVTTSINSTVAPPVNDATTTAIRLVKADTPAQARNYVTRDSIAVRYAEQQDIVDLLSTGHEVEDATDPLASQPTLPGV